MLRKVSTFLGVDAFTNDAVSAVLKVTLARLISSEKVRVDLVSIKVS